MTKEEVMEALIRNDYYILTTARELGVGRCKLNGLIKKYAITIPTKKGVKPKWKIRDHRAESIYYKMVSRCTNPENQDYHHYGGRGIKIYEEWIHSRDSFALYIQSLDNYDNPDYTMDRIDNNGNYEPGNIKFSTRKEQSRNTRRNSILVLDGVSYTAVEFSEKFGLGQDYIKDRLRLGFTPEEILKIPKGIKRKDFYKSSHAS